jgi:beta-glucanase (GH16 family)
MMSLKQKRITSALLKGGLAMLISLGANAAVFQAESYNAFNDTTAGNQGGAFRSDNVDIEATADTGGGYDVGWIETGEWLVYNNLSIPATGSYTVKMRVASPSGATASVDLNAGAIVLGDFAIPSTGGWQNWTTVTKTVNLNAGTYNLGVFAKSAGWNFNWIEVVSNGGGGSTGTVATIYQHCNYGGWSAGVDAAGSYDIAALQAKGFVNDDASSIKVAAGYEAVLYQNAGFSGASVVVRGETACLSNFNDAASSIVIRKIAAAPTWADEFDSINTNTWSFEQGGGGYGNSEREYYTNGQNASIQYDGAAGSNVLVIEARKENPANYNCWYGRCEYTSARMVTSGKKTFTYGRIEARMKLPQTQGIWPAFWLLGNDIGAVGWPQCGEIDIMEHVGFEPVTTHGAMHGPGYSGNTPFIGANYLNESVSNNYHVYAVEWNSTSVKFFVDGTNFYTVNKSQVQTYGNWVYDHPMFILLNVAVGGQWPGSPDGSSTFPQRMYVDYIRVYQ